MGIPSRSKRPAVPPEGRWPVRRGLYHQRKEPPVVIHSRIDIGSDGWLYFATHRGSTQVTADAYHYEGNWICRYNLATGAAKVVAHGPVGKQCIPCSVLDPDRLIFCGSTAAGSATGGVLMPSMCWSPSGWPTECSRWSAGTTIRRRPSPARGAAARRWSAGAAAARPPGGSRHRPRATCRSGLGGGRGTWSTSPTRGSCHPRTRPRPVRRSRPPRGRRSPSASSRTRGYRPSARCLSDSTKGERSRPSSSPKTSEL